MAHFINIFANSQTFGSVFIEGLFNGLALGSVFALMALGYSMVYGIVKMINFAHSEFITIGAFVAFFLIEVLHASGVPYSFLMVLISIIAAILVCVIIAVLTERFAYRPLRQKGSSRITALITAIGVSYIINGVLNVINSEQMEFHQFFDNTTASIIAIVVTAVLLVLLTLFVKKTKIGIAMRAVSENESAAKLMGINNNFIIALTFILGSSLAAIGVVIYLLRYPFFNFTLGSSTIGLYPFVAAVIGGIGSLPGAVVGGFLIGILKQLAVVFGISAWTDAIVYGIFVVILLFKPAGLLGKDTREKV